MFEQKFWIVEKVRESKETYIVPASFEQESSIRLNLKDLYMISKLPNEIELIPIYHTLGEDVLSESRMMIYLEEDAENNPKFLITEYLPFYSTKIIKRGVRLQEVSEFISIDENYGFLEAYNQYRKENNQPTLELHFKVDIPKLTVFIPGIYAKASEVKLGKHWIDLYSSNLTPYYVSNLYQGHYKFNGLLDCTTSIYKVFGENNFIVTQRKIQDVIQKFCTSVTIENLEWAIKKYVPVELIRAAENKVFGANESLRLLLEKTSAQLTNNINRNGDL